MGSATSSKTLPILLLLSLIIAQHVNGELENTILLINQLSQEADIFRCHCFSKDDDLGFHDVSRASPFQWSFNENYLATTLYSCHFWWAHKDKAFDVYGGSIHLTKGIYYSGKYFYYVMPDGFYLSRNGNLTASRKVVTW